MTSLRTAPRPAAGLSADLTLFVGGLALASALELAILRTFTRTAIHIPALSNLQRPYEFVTEFGQYAYFVTVAMIAPVLVMLAFNLGRRGIVATVGLLLFVSVAAAAAIGAAERLWLDLATIASVTVLAVVLVFRLPDRGSALPITCFATAFVLSGSYAVVPAMAALDLTFNQPIWLLDGAEASGLVFAMSSPLLLKERGDRFVHWAAAIAGLLVLVAFIGNASTSRFLLLWNVGLSGTLPGLFYAAAAGALVFTGAGLLRAGRALEAAGLLLLLTGGVGLHSTYQSGLVVVGLATLCYACSPARRSPNATVPGDSRSAPSYPTLPVSPAKSPR